MVLVVGLPDVHRVADCNIHCAANRPYSSVQCNAAQRRNVAQPERETCLTKRAARLGWLMTAFIKRIVDRKEEKTKEESYLDSRVPNSRRQHLPVGSL